MIKSGGYFGKKGYWFFTENHKFWGAG